MYSLGVNISVETIGSKILSIAPGSGNLAGLSTITVLQDQASSKDARAMVRLLDDKGNSVYHPGTSVPANYFLPAGSIINLEIGHEINVGDVIARIPKEGYNLYGTPAKTYETIRLSNNRFKSFNCNFLYAYFTCFNYITFIACFNS